MSPTTRSSTRKMSPTTGSSSLAPPASLLATRQKNVAGQAGTSKKQSKPKRATQLPTTTSASPRTHYGPEYPTTPAAPGMKWFRSFKQSMTSKKAGQYSEGRIWREVPIQNSTQ